MKRATKALRHALTGMITALTLAVAMSPAMALDEAEREEIGAFIREYLIENPEVLIEAQQAYEMRQQADRQAQASQVIESARDQIFNAPGDVALGNPEGDVTIVEFFDYNCGFCKRAHADMQAILSSDDNIRFVPKEFPILGADSIEAHRVSLALRAVAPDNYRAFHDALLSSEHADEQTALAIAAELGIEESDLRAEMENPAIDNQIREAYQLADALGISGTPSYIIGDEAVFGAMGADVLLEKIENVRRCDSATC